MKRPTSNNSCSKLKKILEVIYLLVVAMCHTFRKFDLPHILIVFVFFHILGLFRLAMKFLVYDNNMMNIEIIWQ